MTSQEVQNTITNILNHRNINEPNNSGAKQGLEKALEILKSNQKNLSELIELGTAQARAIAKFAIDFNNHQHDGDFFIKLGEVITNKRKNTDIR